MKQPSSHPRPLCCVPCPRQTNLRTNFFQVYENGHRLLNAHRILNVTAFLMGLVAMIIILTTKAFRVSGWPCETNTVTDPPDPQKRLLAHNASHLAIRPSQVAVSRQERHLLYGFALMFVMFCQILFRIMYPNVSGAGLRPRGAAWCFQCPS